MKLLALLFTVCIVSSRLGLAQAQSPGFVFTIEQSGLNEFLQIFIGIVNQEFQDVQLPDISTEVDAPVVGHISLNLDNIWVRGFSIPSGAITTAPSSAVALDINGVSLTVSLNWSWRKVHWPHLSDHGDLTATPGQGDLAITISFGVDASGHPTVQCTQSDVNFDQMSIHFSGHWDSWLLNLVADLFKNAIKQGIDSAASSQITNIINGKLNSILQSLPLQLHFGGGNAMSDLNIAFIDAEATSVYFTLGSEAQISDAKTGAVCPFPNTPLPDDLVGNRARMVQLFLSATPLSCALWVVTINDGLDKIIEGTTNEWEGVVPQLQLMYPNSTLTSSLHLFALPQLNITTAGVTLGVPFLLNQTVTYNGEQIYTDTLGLDVVAGIDVYIGPGVSGSSQALYGKVTQISLTVEVINTAVGPINLGGLQLLIDIATPIAEAAINDVLATGFPLPVTTGLTLVNPEINFGESYIGVAADITFNA